MGYVATSSTKQSLLLHRLIVDIQNDELVVDHINHNPLDNRRRNLRICTQSQNVFYRKPSKRNKSGVVGVCFDEKSKKWNAIIMCNHNSINLGKYNKIEEAIDARKKAEQEYFEGFTQEDVKRYAE